MLPGPEKAHPKVPRRILLAFLLAVAVPFAAPAGESFAAPAGTVSSDDTQDLAALSNGIFIGLIEKQAIGISETIADIRVIQVFKGPFKPGQKLELKVLSGRVMITQGQPDLSGVQRAVFFLNSADPDGRFTCVKDAAGFKPVINDNVYTNFQDPLRTVKIKKYRETLTGFMPPQDRKRG